MKHIELVSNETSRDRKQWRSARSIPRNMRGCVGSLAFERLPKQNAGLIAGWKLVLSTVFVICLFVASTITLQAQSSSGTSVGTVTDSTGAAVAGATVTLTNVATGDVRNAQTNATGAYEFVNVQPGNYKLDVQASGFKHFTLTNLTIQVGTSTRTDAKLDIGTVSETVEVTSQAALLETQQATIGQVVEGRAVTEMPLNGREIFNLVEVAPGVVPLQTVTPADAATGARGGFAAGNYMISGGIPNAGLQLVDGGSLNTGYINSLAFVPSQDAIQEFNVEGNNISPEYGGTEDGVVAMVTKSGTNEIHGSVADYLRNTVLNANTFFGNQAHLKRPVFIQNQYAATIGGPIKKDKLFYFGSYEGSREAIGTTTTYTVPTLAERAGQLSGTVVDPGGFDPTYTTFSAWNPATCPVGDTMQAATQTTPAECVFTGGVIPASRFDPTAAAELAFWPLPQTSATTNNFVANLTTHPSFSQYLARVDWTINQKARFFARYLYQTEQQNAAPAFGLQQYAYFATKGNGQAHQAVMGYDYTFNATTILNVRLAYLRDTTIQEPMCYPNCDISFTGWPAAQIAQMIPGPFIPRVNVSGLSQTGGAQVIPVHDDDDAISGSVTKILGRHTLKFGGEFRRQPNNYGQDNQQYDEMFNFTNAFTSNAFASYLLGFPQQTTELTAFYPAAMDYYAGVYLGDTFQLNPRLTINGGIRWEYPGYWTERHNRQAVFLPNATNPLSLNGTPLLGDVALVASPAYPGRTPQNPKWDAFSPRLGLAFRLTSKDVIRGGFGLVYAENAIIQQNVQPYNSPINSAFTIINTTTQPNNSFHNPYPQGIIQPVGRAANYDYAAILGQTVDVPVPSNSPESYLEQWNVDYERDFGHQTVFDIAYVGSKANHLPAPGGSNDNGIGLDQLPDQYDSMGSALLNPVSNPFYGQIASGSLAGTTIPAGQLLRPYPQYQNLFNSASAQSFTQYNGLQMKVQKRLNAGGTVLVSYTWDNDHGTADSTTAFGATEPGMPQDYYNLKAENSQLTFNVPQLLVASYVVDLPFGKGKRFLGSEGPLVDRVVGGWGIDGITQYHSGYPVVFTAQPTYLNSTFGAGTPRPNVVAGCNTVNEAGSAVSRVTHWFNTSCFTQPGNYSFGNEPRVDPVIRSQGIANWDIAAFKGTAISERLSLQFRAEIFNAFNRVQFGNPNAVCCSATSTTTNGVTTTTPATNTSFGVVSTQLNQPRQVQFALKLTY